MLYFNFISLSIPEIKALDRQTVKQTDEQQRDLTRVHFFLTRYETLKTCLLTAKRSVLCK